MIQINVSKEAHLQHQNLWHSVLSVDLSVEVLQTKLIYQLLYLVVLLLRIVYQNQVIDEFWSLVLGLGKVVN